VFAAGVPAGGTVAGFAAGVELAAGAAIAPPAGAGEEAGAAIALLFFDDFLLVAGTVAGAAAGAAFAAGAEFVAGAAIEFAAGAAVPESVFLLFDLLVLDDFVLAVVSPGAAAAVVASVFLLFDEVFLLVAALEDAAVVSAAPEVVFLDFVVFLAGVAVEL